MIRSALLLLSLGTGILLFALPQSGTGAPQTGDAASDGKITATAVWQPPQDFITKAHQACDKAMNPASFTECFINQMSAAGAPADAVSFTRMLYQQNGGLVGIMTAFKAYGPVDAAQVFYPLRANDNYALLLVNGDPRIIDVDDLQKLNHQAMEDDPMFQLAKKRYPQIDIWPGDRSGSSPWPRVQSIAGGGTEFIVNYPVINGCHACDRVGNARYGWEFDATGKFLRTVYVAAPVAPRSLTHQHNPPPQSAPQQ
jgi:hypothetical protein